MDGRLVPVALFGKEVIIDPPRLPQHAPYNICICHTISIMVGVLASSFPSLLQQQQKRFRNNGEITHITLVARLQGQRYRRAVNLLTTHLFISRPLTKQLFAPDFSHCCSASSNNNNEVEWCGFVCLSSQPISLVCAQCGCGRRRRQL